VARTVAQIQDTNFYSPIGSPYETDEGTTVDARQLSYFLAIVDEGGYGRAAAALHVAQPSISQAMAALERDLRVPVFTRAGRGVRLTEAGAQLVAPARQVLRDLQAARDVVRSVGALQRGRIEVVTMPSPGIEPLTTITSLFLGMHPAMSLSVSGAFTPDDVVAEVVSGRAEVGLLGASGSTYTADLPVFDIESQPLVLISPPGTTPEGGTTVERSDLIGRPLIVSHRGSLMRQLVDDVLAEGNPVRIVAEVAHRTSILPMVLAGLGEAVLPSAWSRTASRLGATVRRILPPAHLHVRAVTRRSELTPAAAAFMQAVNTYASGATDREHLHVNRD